MQRSRTEKQQLLAIRFLEGSQHTLRDAFDAIDTLSEWATEPARKRLKEVLFATGPLRPDGPQRLLVAPSMQGGVVATFLLDDRRDVTVACLDNESVLFILGKGWTEGLQIEDVTCVEAIHRIREVSTCTSLG
jgi:hypothetical protein